MATVFHELDSPALAINGTADHIHALFRLSRKIALSELVEDVKKRPSKWLKTKGPRFKDFYWQAGYGTFSIGESMVKGVRTYIANQKEHHRHKSFQEEFRSFLSKYRIEYDERYVWD
jgi:REP element-mobilizing transposase RayT